MLEKPTALHKRMRTERSAEIAAACDITRNSVTIEYYDTAMNRVYARSVLFGAEITAKSAFDVVSRLIVTGCREHNIPASAIKSVGIAAEVHVAEYLSAELSPGELYLSPDVFLYYPPFVSMGVSGRFTASLMTIPEANFTAADFGSEICVAEKNGEKLCCAAFPLAGAFDGSGLESGMPAESGAVETVRRDGKTLVYEVIDDADCIGICPCGAAMAASVMLSEGVIDEDGIMYDRDFFFIGEDFFISQSDIRSIQSDKARTAAALSLFHAENGIYLSGEPFSSADGLKALISLGAIPQNFSRAAFARNSVLRGVENCLVSEKTRENAELLARNSVDITDKILPDYDERYINNLKF
ncbi:MAG TPA: hypothetical protein DEQ68_09855 [Ruminococcaceae bacterium]|nr:hypothetical protein [Oscillospiraceae bacterium]